MGNHASNYTYIGGNNYGTASSSKQTETTSVPITATEGINPVRIDATATAKIKLIDYLQARNTHYALQTGIKTEIGDIYDTEMTLQERGLFDIFKNVAGELTGMMSTNPILRTLLNKGVTRLNSYANNTLGIANATKVLSSGINVGRKVSQYLEENYNGVVDTETSESRSLQPGVQVDTATRNLVASGMMSRVSDNLMPDTPVNPSRRRIIYRGRCDKTIKKKSPIKEEVIKATDKVKKGVKLDTKINNQGETVYTCPAAAIDSETHKVDIASTVGAIVDSLGANYSVEQAQCQADSNTAIITHSTPSLALDPNLTHIDEVIKQLNPEQQDLIAEYGKLAGEKYNIRVENPDNPAEPVVSTEIIQQIVNTTPVMTSSGAKVCTIERMKNDIRSAFPTDDYLPEALIANPQDISLLDTHVEQYMKMDWLEAVSPYPNAYSNNNILNANAESVSRLWRLGSMRTGTFCNGLVADQAASDLFKVTETHGEGKTVYIGGALPFNYDLSNVFNGYSAFCDFTLSLFVDSEGEHYGHTVAPGMLYYENAGTLKFLRATKISTGCYSLSFDTSALIDGDLIPAGGSMGKGKWAFAFGSTDVDDLFGKQTRDGQYPHNYCMSVEMGKIELTRNSIDQKVGYWVYRGEPSLLPLMNHMFTLTPVDVQTTHPFDVLTFWRSRVVSQLNPYIRIIAGLIVSESNAPGLHSLWVESKEAMTPHLELEEFKKWIVEVIIDLPSWPLWRGNSPLMKLDQGHVHAFLTKVYMAMRALVVQVPYVMQNTSTLTSAMINLNNDPKQMATSSMVGTRRTKLENIRTRMLTRTITSRLGYPGLYD